MTDLGDWLDEQANPDRLWFVKRLTGNDTLANGAKQAGPYVPKELVFRLFPAVNRPGDRNPDARFDLQVGSHGNERPIRVVWYNNKLHGNPTGGRNEARFTGFGGRRSALLDPDSTGAIAVFSFRLADDGTARDAAVWVSRGKSEDDLIEARLGPVEPGRFITREAGRPVQGDLLARDRPAHLAPSLPLIPAAWLIVFPSGEEIVRAAIPVAGMATASPDARLLRRRECEYDLFRAVEAAFHSPRIDQGFENLDAFLTTAQSILQSRKSRAGKSLELHAREIMIEEGLTPGVDFQHTPVIEGTKRPDFIFPSRDAYENPAFPAAGLRMLAAKTTLRDRWRQMTREADRIAVKHLLTLQEGLSENQFREIRDAGVQLVVPDGLHRRYAAGIRPHLMTFAEFIAEVRNLARPPA